MKQKASLQLRKKNVRESSQMNAEDVAASLSTHEAVCAERYKNIELQFRSSNSRLKRMETIMISAAAAIIGASGAVCMLLIQLLTK
jgi:ABC-type transport system involved in Fe-S cluster assembly fused permease/ATPase subunit